MMQHKLLDLKANKEIQVILTTLDHHLKKEILTTSIGFLILPLPPHMVPEHGPRGQLKTDGLAWPTNFVPMLNPATTSFCSMSSVQ